MAKSVRVKFDRPKPGRYAAGVRSYQEPMARAVTGAFRDAARQIQTGGRARIMSAGLGPRFAREYRVLAFPRRQFSLAPNLRGTHRRGFANTFERGAMIRPKKRSMIWLPLRTAPAKIAGKRPTPALYVQYIGPLVSINNPGRDPLLAGQSLRAITGRATVAQLKTGSRHAAARRGGGPGRRTFAVPVFVGIPQALIRGRLRITPLFAQAAANLPALYRARLQRDGLLSVISAGA